MDNNQELYDRVNRLLGQYTYHLGSQSIPDDVNSKDIYLPYLHKLLEPHEIDIGKPYYVIDIKDKQNVTEGQVKIDNGEFYSSGPFQNYGKLREIYQNPEVGNTYYFEYGVTRDNYDPNATYGSKKPHYYLYLDQDTINKSTEIPHENVFKISDDARNVPFYETDVRRVAGKKRKKLKSKKQKKTKKHRRLRSKKRHH